MTAVKVWQQAPAHLDRAVLFQEQSFLHPAACGCCRHDLVEDLTTYLYNASLLKYIEGYVQKVSPQKTPQVCGRRWCCAFAEGVVVEDCAGCLRAGTRPVALQQTGPGLCWAGQLSCSAAPVAVSLYMNKGGLSGLVVPVVDDGSPS